jgi:hypothetical protein
MSADAALALVCVLISALVTLPAIQAMRGRQASRVASEVATELAEL